MFENEAGRLRRMVGAGASVFFRRHALEEMGKDGIARADIERMLGRCRVTLVEDSKGETTWRAEGPDHDGRPITAVIVAYEDQNEIKVITAWAN